MMPTQGYGVDALVTQGYGGTYYQIIEAMITLFSKIDDSVLMKSIITGTLSIPSLISYRIFLESIIYNMEEKG